MKENNVWAILFKTAMVASAGFMALNFLPQDTSGLNLPLIGYAVLCLVSLGYFIVQGSKGVSVVTVNNNESEATNSQLIDVLSKLQGSLDENLKQQMESQKALAKSLIGESQGQKSQLVESMTGLQSLLKENAEQQNASQLAIVEKLASGVGEGDSQLAHEVQNFKEALTKNSEKEMASQSSIIEKLASGSGEGNVQLVEEIQSLKEVLTQNAEQQNASQLALVEKLAMGSNSDEDSQLIQQIQSLKEVLAENAEQQKAFQVSIVERLTSGSGEENLQLVEEIHSLKEVLTRNAEQQNASQLALVEKLSTGASEGDSQFIQEIQSLKELLVENATEQKAFQIASQQTLEKTAEQQIATQQMMVEKLTSGAEGDSQLANAVEEIKNLKGVLQEGSVQQASSLEAVTNKISELLETSLRPRPVTTESSESGEKYTELMRENESEFLYELKKMSAALQKASSEGVEDLKEGAKGYFESVSERIVQVNQESFQKVWAQQADFVAQLSEINNSQQEVNKEISIKLANTVEALEKSGNGLLEQAEVAEINQVELKASIELFNGTMTQVVEKLEGKVDGESDETNFVEKLTGTLEAFHEKSTEILIENSLKTREILSELLMDKIEGVNKAEASAS